MTFEHTRYIAYRSPNAQDGGRDGPGEVARRRPQDIDIDSVRTLKVGLVGGQIDIIGHDEPGARVEVHSVSGKDLKSRIDGDTLEIDHPQLGWDNFLDVFRYLDAARRGRGQRHGAPRFALKLGVVSAQALVTGVSEDASLSTVSGDLVARQLSGDLIVNTVSGELSPQPHRQGQRAQRRAATSRPGPAALATRPTASAATSSSTPTGIPDQVSVNTVSGDVTVRLEADAPAVVHDQHRRRASSSSTTASDHRHQGPLHRQVRHARRALGRRARQLGRAATSASCRDGEGMSPGRLRARPPAALPAQPARRAVHARLRADPGAERPLRRHLRAERRHHLPAPRQARGGGARDQGGRRPQDRLRDHGCRPGRARRPQPRARRHRDRADRFGAPPRRRGARHPSPTR